MSAESNTQRLLARLVAENLEECGHDVTTLDLLDALASEGVALVATDSNPASEAYFEAIRESTGGDLP